MFFAKMYVFVFSYCSEGPLLLEFEGMFAVRMLQTIGTCARVRARALLISYCTPIIYTQVCTCKCVSVCLVLVRTATSEIPTVLEGSVDL